MKLGFLFLTIFLIVAGCSSPTELGSTEQNQVESNPSLQTPPPSTNNENDPAIIRNQQDQILNSETRASLEGQFESSFLDPSQVKVIDSGEVEWSDSCMGIDRPGIECTPQVTKGYMVILEANGLQFKYHADQVGGQVHPATLGLIWTREGGEDQLCDKLVIYLPDTAHACWCQAGEKKSAMINLQDILTIDEYEQLIDSLRNYRPNTFNQDATDGPGPVAVSLTFHGQGNTSPQVGDQQKLLALAESIFTRITP